MPMQNVFSVIQVVAASENALSGSLNVLHEAVLLWSYQQSAHAQRVRGVVDESWGAGQVAEEEEHFSPTIYRQFDKNTIHAPLLWWVSILTGFPPLRDLSFSNSLV